MTLKVITPEGGQPSYHIALALRNRIIGSVTFENKNDLDIFLQAYEPLGAYKFGLLELHIDCTEDEDNG